MKKIIVLQLEDEKKMQRGENSPKKEMLNQ